MKVLQDDLEFHTVQNIIDYSQNQVTLIDKTFDVFEVGYEIDIIDNDPTQKEDTNNVTNSYLISPQFPFPVSGTLYSPAHITEPFKESEFQLISFVSDGVIINEVENVVIEEDNMIEESSVISIDEIIVEETVEENITDEIIEEPIAEEITIEEEIIEPIIIESVEEITEEIITDKETTNSNLSLDKSITLVILLSVVFGGVFVYYKKFRNSNKNFKKSFVKNNNSIFNKIIHFDDKKLQSKSKKNQNRIFSSV